MPLGEAVPMDGPVAPDHRFRKYMRMGLISLGMMVGVIISVMIMKFASDRNDDYVMTSTSSTVIMTSTSSTSTSTMSASTIITTTMSESSSVSMK
jgi:hypothetical protein